MGAKTAQGEEGSALSRLSLNTPMFEQYECLDSLRMGHFAGKRSTFNIIGVGRATFLTNVEGAVTPPNYSVLFLAKLPKNRHYCMPCELAKLRHHCKDIFLSLR
jgi:hypothetical protein